jgi:diguanylate cyclase (GGDEF)-like protein
VPALKRSLPTIGILPGWSVMEGKRPDRYLAAVLRSIQATARDRGCHLLLGWGLGRVTDLIGLHPAWPVASPDVDFVPVGPWNTDGLIVFAPLRHEGHSRYLQELTDCGFPVLFIATGERDPMISVDNEGGIRQAMAHLVEHGHRRIAYVAGDPTDQGDSAARLSAYQSAAGQHGLSRDPRLVVAGWHNYTGGYDAARAILGSGVKFTALLASDDSSAIGAMQAIRDAGLRIPRDVAVIGFDDQPDAIAQVPPLASVHVSLRQIGHQALALMLDHLAGRRALQSIQIPTHLTLRQSCGCLPRVIASAGDRGRPAARRWPARQAPAKLVNEVMAAMQMPGAALPPITRRLCGRLVRAFHESLQAGGSTRFQAVLMATLQELELADADLNPWQEMISTLRREMTGLPAAWQRTGTRRLAEDMLHQARAALGESAQRQDNRHQSQREIAAHALSELTAQLSATLDQSQTVQVLESHLADVGIRHVRVALFEPEGDDPFGGSLILNPDPEVAGQRFLSRDFPPARAYPDGELLNLALVPLVFQEEPLGYVAFDAANLEPVAMIARQLAATLKTSRLHAQVLEFSLTDPLTGVYNRRYFDLFLGNEVDRSRRFGRGLAIIMLDIDDLKHYNDTYGHPVGDLALKFAAQCLEKVRRRADVVARIGGDEFALILPETETEGAQIVAGRIAAAIADSLELEHGLTVSMGISILHGANVEAGALVQRADHALYEAKRAGRNKVRVFEEKTVRKA